jgi:adenylate cyclase class 2
MYEVEVKVPADHAAVRERLDELDAERVDRVVQEDTYFDAPHREFAETDEALRLRRETDADARETVAEVTYKGPLVDADSKTREEVETAVADGEALTDLLGNLGFAPAATVRKERERYRLDGYTVTLDVVDDAGAFVEVETHAEEVDEAREGAFAVLERLGLDPDDQVRTSYLGMVLDDVSE